jgi:hypothetical protein
MESPSPSSGPRWNAWNLLLLVPFLMLVVPWLNRDQPRLIGMPFFYWSQFAFVPIGVICVAIVYRMTRTEPTVPALDEPSAVDELDEGSR